MQSEPVDAALAKAGSVVTYSGATAASVGWLTVNEMAALIGAVAAVIGLAAQIYFSVARNRRERELHAAQMDEIRRHEG